MIGSFDSGFGHWFAGLADGEGSFVIFNNHPSLGCRFAICLRGDDVDTLRLVHETLGIGDVYEWLANYKNYKNYPIAQYVVRRKPECLVLREIFETYPLRSKKKWDFEVWSLALDCWNAHKPGDSWEEMECWKAHLQDGRKLGAVR